MRPDVPKISLTDVVFPDRANHYGTLFGGHALHLMGKAAFIAATRHTRQHVVMASIDRIIFDEPIHVGELIECVASIARIGRSSMTVAVDLMHEDALGGQRRAAVRGTFEMVAVDATGRPVPISVSRHSNDVQEEAVT